MCYAPWLSWPQTSNRPDDGGSTHLCNVGLLQRDYTALHSRKLLYSRSPPGEPEISHEPVSTLCAKIKRSKYSKSQSGGDVTVT
jgi:hypothetical protein